MIRLIEVSINKYKSFQSPQVIKIEDSVTVLVGMNEAGKTVLLEGLAKLNYFNPKDSKFKFNSVHDYPRREYIAWQKSNQDAEIIRAKFSIPDTIINAVNKDLGSGVFSVNEYEFYRTYKQDGSTLKGITCDLKSFFKHLVIKHKDELSPENIQKIESAVNISDLDNVEFQDESILKNLLNTIKQSTWSNPLAGYIYHEYIRPYQPKFWYFDDYYKLEGRININDYKANKYSDETKEMIEALLEIAGIDVDELIDASDFESFTALLEAASSEISDQLFKYWKGNDNLEIEFKIDKIIIEQNKEVKIYNPSYPNNESYATKTSVKETISEIIIDIRVKNTSHKVTLPLDRRSKGFNWFFSFVVWFSKIKNDSSSNHILLFDEPGLNLHALAQQHLLDFLEDLGKEYQVIYSTHSPFMIDSHKLNRVRTIVETTNGSVASETIQEKNPDTLFPLQAALGYDIAQNLFISKNNLLVEGPADLLYLTFFSSLLQKLNRTGLNDNITIVPTGGLDKVASFVSLIRGSKLNVACILDTFSDAKGKQRLQDMISYKIIKEKNVRFFDEFISGATSADIEDLFVKDDYLKIFNSAFSGKYQAITLNQLNTSISQIIIQINKALNIDRFNHYIPSYKLVQSGVDESYFHQDTLSNFENVFKELNKLF